MLSKTNQTNTPTISLEEAIAMTKRYRDNREKILKPEYGGKDILPLNETFNLINFTNPEVKAFRIYYGMTDDLLIQAIIVGVNERNEDVLPKVSISTSSQTSLTGNESLEDVDDPIIVDADRCPTVCPEDGSPLNG